MNGIEALQRAIQVGEGWMLRSVSWRNHNPCNLMESPWAADRDSGGHCIFTDDLVGISAARWDLMQKLSGMSGHLKAGGATVENLLVVWTGAGVTGLPASYAAAVIASLQEDLGRPVILDTLLSSIWRSGDPAPALCLF